MSMQLINKYNYVSSRKLNVPPYTTLMCVMAYGIILKLSYTPLFKWMLSVREANKWSVLQENHNI